MTAPSPDSAPGTVVEFMVGGQLRSFMMWFARDFAPNYGFLDFVIALHDAGLPVGPDRCERLARAVTIMGATTVAELRACALATMVSDPGQMPTFDRVFAAVFGGPSPFRQSDSSEAYETALARLRARARRRAGHRSGTPGHPAPAGCGRRRLTCPRPRTSAARRPEMRSRETSCATDTCRASGDGRTAGFRLPLAGPSTPSISCRTRLSKFSTI